MNRVITWFEEHKAVIFSIESLLPLIEQASFKITEKIQKGGTIFLMGNGGSAADAQHLGFEFLGRFKQERRAIAAIALTTDSSVVTGLSNDYDYSVIFERQIEALCKPNDIVIALTTSGNSLNLIKGVKLAKEIGAFTISLSGKTGGELAKLVDLEIRVPSQNVARIQEAQLFIGHCICELVEQNVAEWDKKLESVSSL